MYRVLLHILKAINDSIAMVQCANFILFIFNWIYEDDIG